ncbi:MAG: T9SS type A sorting domain-containing protein [Clostridiales bacterium]
MKKFYQRFGLKIILVFTMLSSGIVMAQSNDVCVRITETTLNEALQTMIDARAINLGDYTHTWLAKGWFINLDGGSIDILPNRKARISGGIVATATDVLTFVDNITSHVNIVIDGEIELRPDSLGYKLIFKPTDANAYNPDDSWDYFSSLLTVAADIGMKVFIYKMPEIELTSGTKLLPEFMTSYFSSSIPELSTTDTEIILGYSVAGTRKITIQNEVWDNTSSPNYSSGMIQVLEGSAWKSYNSPYTAWWDLNSTHSVRTASLINYNNANYRFSKWNINNIATNDISIQVQGDESFNASFFAAQPITIRTSLEGTLTSDQNMTFQNQTVKSPYSDYAFMPPKSTSFGALPTLGSSFWKFYRWREDGSTSLNRTTSLTSEATYTAEYKASVRSNAKGAFQNPGQKKTKSDGVNTSVLVYESMNSICMETSNDMGVNWTICNPVSPAGIAKDPSIDGTDGAERFYLVGYTMSDAQANTTKIMAAEVNGFSDAVNKVVYDNIPGSTYDTQPVVACLSVYQSPSAVQKAIMIWRQPATQGFGGTLPAGLYYRTGSVVSGSNGKQINWDVYNNGVYINGTDINSFNPTVAGVRDQYTTIPMMFHMAYSQKVGNQSIIKYTSFTINNVDGSVSQPLTQVISDPIYVDSYYQLNEKPSITLVNNVPYVAWKNYSDATYMQSAVLRWKIGDTTWADTRHYAGKDDDATSVHISNTGNMSSRYTGFVMGWNTSYSGDQFVKSSSLSTIYSSNKSGQGIQVMGGSKTDFSDSYLISFNNSTLPYSFMSSNAIPLGTLAKVSADGEGRTVEERSGLIKLNNFFIKASIGDLTFNGNKIEFKEPKDTLGNSLENFKGSLETETMDVASSGILTYTAGFESGDSLKALSILKDGNNAGFSVEIVDAETGLVLKKLNSFVLSPSSHKREHAQSFRLDLSGIGMKKVALRLSSELNLKDSTKAEYFVLRSYAVQRKARKDNFVDLNYSESARVTEYGLSQNYPNPFNPTTVINYQIPKASKVMLKIYDMLGKEVTTLVNEYKEQGRYSVEFNASNLPSGTYIYEIRANDFVKSGKMMLLK